MRAIVSTFRKVSTGPDQAHIDTTSLKRINATTVERPDKKGGKVVGTITRVVSADGKSLTLNQKGTNAQGRAFSDVVVLDKQ